MPQKHTKLFPVIFIEGFPYSFMEKLIVQIWLTEVQIYEILKLNPVYYLIIHYMSMEWCFWNHHRITEEHKYSPREVKTMLKLCHLRCSQ